MIKVYRIRFIKTLKPFHFSSSFFFREILFLETPCIRLWVSSSPEAIDEVVSRFGSQLMRVTLGKNEFMVTYSSCPALVTPIF